jgi:PhnB protein
MISLPLFSVMESFGCPNAEASTNRRGEMSMSTTQEQPCYVPGGYQALMPYLTFQDCAKAIEFYKTVFGATEKMRLADPTGRIGHAELNIGGQTMMMADECPTQSETRNAWTLGGTPVALHLYVENVDAIVAHAAFEGAQILRSPADQFYGDRSGVLRDPFGHVWFIATRFEDVPLPEMEKRAAKAMKEFADAK